MTVGNYIATFRMELWLWCWSESTSNRLPLTAALNLLTLSRRRCFIIIAACNIRVSNDQSKFACFQHRRNKMYIYMGMTQNGANMSNICTVECLYKSRHNHTSVILLLWHIFGPKTKICVHWLYLCAIVSVVMTLMRWLVVINFMRHRKSLCDWECEENTE